jgi:hypothetical protein
MNQSSARTSQVSYYDVQACSNSALSQLKRELSAQDQQEYKEALIIGSLVDAMLTDPSAIDMILRTCNGQKFTDEQWRIALRTKDAFNNSYVCRFMKEGSELQKEFYGDMEFEYNGLPFQLPCKAKLDGYKGLIRLAWDLKTTSAKTLQEFEIMVDRLDYDRGAVWYMRMADCDKFVILGVSKGKRPEIFPVTIERNSWRWQHGEEKVNEYAWKYWMLKQNQ